MISLSETEKELIGLQPNVETNFHVGVNADKPHFIKYIKVSCGCTTPELTSNTVSPESPSIMNVKFTPNGTGYHKKTIWLGYEEEGKTKEAEFSFKSNVT